jgi:hypothetical protein
VELGLQLGEQFFLSFSCYNIRQLNSLGKSLPQH